MESCDAVVLNQILARSLSTAAAKARAAFVAAMDDDFNTGAAIAALFTLLAEARRHEGEAATTILSVVRDLGRLIGLFYAHDVQDTESLAMAAPASDAVLEQVMALVITLRQAVRAQRDFATADRMRLTLEAAGLVIKDAKDGATWSRTATATPTGSLDAAMAVVLDLRQLARTAKDFATADHIRSAVTAAGLQIVDEAAGARWQTLPQQ
jgi:cysteinyl-tRNA synthetase